MELTGKQVRYLRSLANKLDSVLIVGKNGILDSSVKQANESLEAHELMKGSVSDGSPLTAREAGEELAERTGANLVQVIGHRFVLYRETSREDVEKIKLPE